MRRRTEKKIAEVVALVIGYIAIALGAYCILLHFLCLKDAHFKLWRWLGDFKKNCITDVQKH